MGGCCGSGKKKKEEKVIKELKAGKKKIFWIFGGPGSGKGTQCLMLSKKYGFVHLSTGDLLRAEVEHKSKLGEEIHQIMVTGQLVSRQIVLEILTNAIIKNYDTAEGFLIDGYPREVIQGKEFEEQIGPCCQILYFECSDETLKARLLGRAETSGRLDDTEEAIGHRIKLFHDVSEPVIKEYAAVTTTINGEEDPDTVFTNCSKKIDEILGQAI